MYTQQNQKGIAISNNLDKFALKSQIKRNQLAHQKFCCNLDHIHTTISPASRKDQAENGCRLIKIKSSNEHGQTFDYSSVIFAIMKPNTKSFEQKIVIDPCIVRSTTSPDGTCLQFRIHHGSILLRKLTTSEICLLTDLLDLFNNHKSVLLKLTCRRSTVFEVSCDTPLHLHTFTAEYFEKIIRKVLKNDFQRPQTLTEANLQISNIIKETIKQELSQLTSGTSSSRCLLQLNPQQCHLTEGQLLNQRKNRKVRKNQLQVGNNEPINVIEKVFEGPSGKVSLQRQIAAYQSLPMNSYFPNAYYLKGTNSIYIEEMNCSYQQIMRATAYRRLFRLDIAHQLVNAILAMHSSGVTHRDLKPNNITFKLNSDNRFTLKIVDFGDSYSSKANSLIELDSTEETKATSSSAFTFPFSAPESWLCKSKQLNQAHEVDLWSLGLLLWSILLEKYPFQNRVPSGPNVWAQWKNKLCLLNSLNVSDPSQNLIKIVLMGLLSKDPSKRLSLGQIQKIISNYEKSYTVQCQYVETKALVPTLMQAETEVSSETEVSNEMQVQL